VVSQHFKVVVLWTGSFNNTTEIDSLKYITIKCLLVI